MVVVDEKPRNAARTSQVVGVEEEIGQATQLTNSGRDVTCRACSMGDGNGNHRGSRAGNVEAECGDTDQLVGCRRREVASGC